MKNERIDISTTMIQWALDTAQVSREAAILKFPFLEKVFSSTGKGTINQYQSFCDSINIPFPMLLLDEPLDSKILTVKFRTIENERKGHLSKNLQDLIQEMLFRQNWISDYRRNNEMTPISFQGTMIGIKKQVQEVSQRILALLGFDQDWMMKVDRDKIYETLLTKIERLGCIVMSSGIVENNTHRPIDISECRGFVLNDEYAPLIFINSRDDIHARSFTLLHEFIHLLFENQQNIVGDDIYEESDINAVVSEILIPQKLLLAEIVKYDNIGEQELSDLAKKFSVSLTSMAISLLKLKVINQALMDYITEKVHQSIKKKQRGGDYYRTAASHLSPMYSMSVLTCIDNQTVGYSDGCRLLGVKPSGLETLRDHIYRRMMR